MARRAADAWHGPGASPRVRQQAAVGGLDRRETAGDPMSVAARPADDLLVERELVERAKHDPEAFGRLYERNRIRVYSFACSRLRDPDDAEDVTAEVFMRAWQAIGRYQSNGSPFAAWLYRIASNAIVDLHRKRRVVLEDIDQHQGLAAAGSVEDLVAERDRMRRIEMAARRLPVPQRTALALRFGHDLTQDAIARRMGRSRSAIRLLQYRAIVGVRAAVGAGADALGLAS